jgi:GNAT superfamily N-acetyltransferase
MVVRSYTLQERPELERVVAPLLEVTWPRFVLHDPVAGRLWPRVVGEFADHHVGIVDEPAGELIGIGYSIPFAWDGSTAGLPAGWQAVVTQALADHDQGRAATAVAALSITVAPGHQGRGLSRSVLGALRDTAAAHGFATLVAPVRPSHKSRYPLTPMERYVRWTLPDGAPFDPWLRTHWRFGAEPCRICPASMVITAPVAAWEEWTGMAFPDSGSYVVPGALVPVTIDRERDIGRYAEPNLWVRHTLRDHRSGSPARYRSAPRAPRTPPLFH